jgi:hypothetical protein
MRARPWSLAALLAAAAALVPASAAAQDLPLEYAVKVVCGAPDAAVAGTYMTAVNVHNPDRDAAAFRFKVATAGTVRVSSSGQASAVGGAVSPFQQIRVDPDGALTISCREIERLARATSVDGFVVIQSSVELDVVAVYMGSSTAGPVSTLDVERYTPRRR